MGSNHLAFAKEDVWGTWKAPTLALPVRSANFNPTQPYMQPQDTGGGRGSRAGAPGERGATGQIVANMYLAYWNLLRAMFATRQSAAAGTGFKTTMTIDDEVAFDSFSFQQIYGAADFLNVRGAKPNGFTINARVREFAQVTIPFIAKDAVAALGTWADGSAAPLIVDPIPYPAVLPPAMKFYEAELRIGGTVALISNELVVTGGDAVVGVDNVNLVIAENLAADAFGINLGDRTVQDISEGARVITLAFDPNFGLDGVKYLKAWLDGENAVARLHFQGPDYGGGFHHEAFITLPNLQYAGAPLPDLTAAYGLRRQTVTANCVLEDTTGLDIGVTVQTTEDLQ